MVTVEIFVDNLKSFNILLVLRPPVHMQHLYQNEILIILGNSKGSPSPDHFNSDSNTSSSQPDGVGQYSRGATPVNNVDNQVRDGSNQGQRFDRVSMNVELLMITIAC